jgi:aminocarboxymuconate-semialdehyde decarboxylase
VVVVDVHTHLMPPSAREAARRGGDWYGSTFETSPKGEPVLVTGTKRRTIAALGHLLEAHERVAAMDQLGVDVQVLSLLPLIIGYDLPAGDAIAMARAVNDEIGGYIESFPTRFLGLAALPATDTDAAVAEMERAMALPGFVGIEIGSNVAGTQWDDPRLFPILEAAERLDAFVFLHPNDVRARGTYFPRYYTSNGIGNPLETTTAAAALIFGGVLDRLPDLRVCLAHGGGYIAFAAGRLDHVRKARPEVAGSSALPPSDYLRRLRVDALTHSAQAVRYLVDVLGAERVLLGSDYPADMAPADPAGEVERNPVLTAEEKAAILDGNARREFGKALPD